VGRAAEQVQSALRIVGTASEVDPVPHRRSPRTAATDPGECPGAAAVRASTMAGRTTGPRWPR